MMFNKRFGSVSVIAMLVALGWWAAASATAAAAWVEEAKLIAGDGGQASALYGYSVAIDGGTAMVGDGGASKKVYVYERAGSSWTGAQILTPSDAGLTFGRAVAMDGDTAAIGAYQADSSLGAVYVFDYNGTDWVQKQKLPGVTASNRLGGSVAIQGTRILAGATNNAPGEVLVFDYDGTSWSQTAQLVGPVFGTTKTRFGSGVAVDGDTALIGAEYDPTLGTYAGAAYIYEYDGTNWAQSVKLLAGDGAASDRFGNNVSLFDDIAVVGTMMSTKAGAVYIYQRDSDGNGVDDWAQVAKLAPADIAVGDGFGMAVALEGETLLVGAPGYSANSRPGAVYVFEEDGGNWTLVDKLTAGGVATNRNLGRGLDWDGVSAIAGAIYDDDNASDAGAAYVFAIPEPGTGSLLGIAILTLGLVVLERKRK